MENFFTEYRTKILQLKELLNIKEFHMYQDTYGACCDDLAGMLFKNKHEKMLFLLKHPEIIDTIVK